MIDMYEITERLYRGCGPIPLFRRKEKRRQYEHLCREAADYIRFLRTTLKKAEEEVLEAKAERERAKFQKP